MSISRKTSNNCKKKLPNNKTLNNYKKQEQEEATIAREAFSLLISFINYMKNLCHYKAKRKNLCAWFQTTRNNLIYSSTFAVVFFFKLKQTA